MGQSLTRVLSSPLPRALVRLQAPPFKTNMVSMQVTSRNWSSELVEEWKEDLKHCEFVAMDTELTGLSDNFPSNKGEPLAWLARAISASRA